MATSTTKIPYIEGAAPATPSAGEVVTYAKADGLMYSKDDAGTETLLSGGTPATRASLGLDTTDSPEFAALNIGAASDTTLARASAGNLTVEGNALYRAGGTDVPIADGGTGASTKAAAFDALSPMTTSGDIIYGGASGTGTRLAAGSNGHVLTLASGVPSWAAAGGGGGVSQSYVGFNTVGASAEVGATAATTVYVMSVTLASTSHFQSIGGNVRMNTLGGTDFMVGLWTDSGSAPANLIALNHTGPASASVVGHQSAANGWYSVPLLCTVAAGTYWIGFGFNGQGTLWSMMYDAGAGGKLTLSNNGMLADGTYQASFASGARSYSVRASILS